MRAGKQPNGLYCVIPVLSSYPTIFNITAEDYINLCVDEAIAEARDDLKKYLLTFEEIIEMCIEDMPLDKFADFLIGVGYMKEPTIQKEFKSFLEENNVEKEFLMLKFKDKKESKK